MLIRYDKADEREVLHKLLSGECTKFKLNSVWNQLRSALDSVQDQLSFYLRKSNKWSYGWIESWSILYYMFSDDTFLISTVRLLKWQN